MYNRYIPQPDGSFRKNAVADQPQPGKRQEPHPPASRPPQPEPPACPPKAAETPPRAPQHACPSRQECSMGSFLRSLLPQGFDTGDLLVVLLLLLIAGDTGENRSSALLTLALYFVL